VIDLYQVHMQDRNVAIDETLRALDDLVTEGKVRYIGCANYAGYSLVESLWAADRLQTHRYESIQLQWSLAQRSAERELILASTYIRMISGPLTTRRTGIYSTWSAELRNSMKPLIPLRRVAWLLARPQTSSILVGARTEAQLEDNLRALSVKLTSEDLKELDEASRPNWDYPWDVIRDAEAGDAKLLA
jgi:aryl-alcohol dehydrogenase-like predicted oxidoreductase